MSRHKLIKKNLQIAHHLKEDDVQNAIIKTLSYRSIFDYPMTFHQLATFLISNKEHTFEELKEGLNGLFKKGILDFRHNGYYLAKTSPVNWQARTKEAKTLMENCESILTKLGKIPWVKMIAVTGSTASFNSTKNDDIDIFIVTERNRIWLTRFFMVLILKNSGLYRTDRDYSGKICPNIYVDEASIAWPPENQNIYVAHEIVMMHPVVNKDDTYFKFLNNNLWIKKFFSGFEKPYVIKTKEKDNSKIMNLVDTLFMWLQRIYMKKRKTNEITRKGIIHFNKKDWSQKVLKEYRY